MAVFPESMDRIDPKDTESAFGTLESYIRYMVERMEFSMSNLGRTVTSGGMTTAQMYIMLTAQENTVSALSSTVNQLQAELSSAKGSLAEVKTAAEALEARVKALEEKETTGGGEG